MNLAQLGVRRNARVEEFATLLEFIDVSADFFHITRKVPARLLLASS